jgi:ubiquitin C-terminal hydrolase
MPKARKPRAGQGKPKRQAAARQGPAAAQPIKNAADAKAKSAASVSVAASASGPASTSQAASSPIGLVNLGHTCYFNAVLQVMTSSPYPKP